MRIRPRNQEYWWLNSTRGVEWWPVVGECVNGHGWTPYSGISAIDEPNWGLRAAKCTLPFAPFTLNISLTKTPMMEMTKKDRYQNLCISSCSLHTQTLLLNHRLPSPFLQVPPISISGQLFPFFFLLISHLSPIFLLTHTSISIFKSFIHQYPPIVCFWSIGQGNGQANGGFQWLQ